MTCKTNENKILLKGFVVIKSLQQLFFRVMEVKVKCIPHNLDILCVSGSTNLKKCLYS